MQREGQILKDFIENQKTSKQAIAKQLDMSRSNLYQLFKSEQLEIGTKKKINSFFETDIFQIGGHVVEATGPSVASEPIIHRLLDSLTQDEKIMAHSYLSRFV